MSQARSSLIVSPAGPMPAPTLSSACLQGFSSSNSSVKRKRESSDSSYCTQFSASTKNKLLQLCGELCWQCGARSVIYNCNVIPQKDRAFTLYKAKGLISFDSLASLDNGIRLCPLCHAEFDDLLSPGFIFFPRDLRFFINYEIEDYARREDKARAGHPVPDRRCPSAEDYLKNEMTICTGEEGAIGGLYERIFLRDYLSPLGRAPDFQPFREPKRWHGAPLATIMRVFLIHGSPVVGMGLFSQDQRISLRTLQDLYLRADPKSTVVEERAPRGKEPNELHVECDSPSRLGNVMLTRPSNPNGAEHPSSDNIHDDRSLYYDRSTAHQDALSRPAQGYRGARCEHIEDSAIGVSTKTNASPPGIPPNVKERTWGWGPYSTSEDKAIWYPRMMGWNKPEQLPEPEPDS